MNNYLTVLSLDWEVEWEKKEKKVIDENLWFYVNACELFL